ncbi:MAG: hybrid sensor histidine kinase/response regulator [Deltaproteobacteria bacterium]|nr:MAG: hybrid sensor histidine kinase/response regulator [Deltaproteobacteria bacterium]
MGEAERPSILVVDDEADVVESIRELLRLDYRVLVATRASEAISILQEGPVDVVMTDQRMPEMTGVELLHHVRETQPDTVRLLFTGYADVRAVIDAINRGNIYRYITKPWDPEDLQVVVRDAVERHDLIAERQRLLGELQRTNEELIRANTELAATSELKSNFIRVASHELRTPLTILMLLTHLATRADDVAEPLHGWIVQIAAATDRLQRRVDDLTSMLAVEKFERPLARQALDLFALLETAAEEVRPFIALRNQTLVRDYRESLGTMELEGEKIRDCLSHLLLNAVKFTPDAGRITLAARRFGDGGAEIRVSDTGAGIDAASRARVFEPFFTAFDVSGHSSGLFEFERRGLGLGLTVAKAFVEMHGGEVGVESELGRGTTFTVTLRPGRAATATLGNGDADHLRARRGH